jgi:hypothetical protein
MICCSGRRFAANQDGSPADLPEFRRKRANSGRRLAVNQMTEALNPRATKVFTAYDVSSGAQVEQFLISAKRTETHCASQVAQKTANPETPAQGG